MKLKPWNPIRIYRNHMRGSRPPQVLYLAKFEGGDLDGRQQAMYGRARSYPRPELDKGQWSQENGQWERTSDLYLCETPNRRVQSFGETIIYRHQPVLNL